MRHGHRERTLTGTFGKTRIAVPRARLTGEDGKTREWRSGSLRAYRRRTQAADALIAGAYLAGTNTRRVRRALNAVFAGPVGKDVVGASGARRRATGTPGMRVRSPKSRSSQLILDGTVARVRLDGRATSISLLVALGVRADSQKMLLAIENMGGEGKAAWRALLDDLVRRGLPNAGAGGHHRRRAGPRKGGGGAATARHGCPTLHRAQASQSPPPTRPSALHEEISNDYRDMIYAATRSGSRPGRKAFILSCRPQMPRRRRQPWRRPATGCSHSRGSRQANGNRSEPRTRSSDCTRSSSAGSRLGPCYPAPKPPPCCSGRCSPSGQITMRKVDGWQTLAEKPDDQIIDLAA